MSTYGSTISDAIAQKRVEGILKISYLLIFGFSLGFVLDLFYIKNFTAASVMIIGLLFGIWLALRVVPENIRRTEMTLLVFGFIVVTAMGVVEASRVVIAWIIPIAMFGTSIVETKRAGNLVKACCTLLFIALYYLTVKQSAELNSGPMWDMAIDLFVLLGLVFFLLRHFSAIQRLIFEESVSRAKAVEQKLAHSLEIRSILDRNKNALLEAQRAEVKRVAQNKVLQASIEARQEQLEQFAYAASHDLKEPVRTIRSFSQVARKRLPADLQENKNLIEYFNHVGTSADRMHVVLESLLTYSRATRNEARPEHVEVVDLWKRVLMKNAVGPEQVATLAKEHTAWVDRNALAACFEAILANALTFASPERQLRIQFTCTVAAQQLSIRIADNGIGIAPVYREQVFELFKRLHTREMYEGSGIGLALVKRLVQRNQGQVAIEDGMDGGIAIVLTFPIQAPPPIVEPLEDIQAT